MNNSKYKNLDVIQFMEEALEIKLLPYQKILLKSLDKIEDKAFICYPPRTEYTDYRIARDVLKIILNIDSKED